MLANAPSHVTTTVWWPQVLVAACALVFTVASFWWLNVRRGRLVSFEPHSFAAYYSRPVLLVRLPLVLHNTGAAPIVVQDLRLAFPHEPDSVIPLPWRTTRDRIDPRDDDKPRLPAVFAVAGRSAERHFIEFGCPFPGFALEPRDYSARIEVELGHRKGWQPLLNLPIRAGHITTPDRYLAYSNSPNDVTPEDRQKAAAALQSVLDKVQAAQTDTRPSGTAEDDPA